jgi:predicted PilT family ATPase
VKDASPRLEEVFKTQGIPEHNFIVPSHSDRLTMALRTPGRGVVIEGPSGIGKSTAVLTTLRSLGLEGQIPVLSSRDPSDLEIISELPNWTDFGTVVIDDFHRLPVDEHKIGSPTC